MPRAPCIACASVHREFTSRFGASEPTRRALPPAKRATIQLARPRASAASTKAAAETETSAVQTAAFAVPLIFTMRYVDHVRSRTRAQEATEVAQATRGQVVAEGSGR